MFYKNWYKINEQILCLKPAHLYFIFFSENYFPVNLFSNSLIASTNACTPSLGMAL